MTKLFFLNVCYVLFDVCLAVLRFLDKMKFGITQTTYMQCTVPQSFKLRPMR